MKLILVESPTKSKTLSKFLGDEYKILSTKGHIRDLPQKKLGVDTENDFEPNYVIPKRQKKTIKKLKKELSDAEQIILSTDPDREGEAISWHLKEALDLKDYQRVSFHEITKEAILNALEDPRDIDEDLVNAQQARRVLDRLVGYKLSPLLWKKIYRDFSLSAGRVQSVALRLVAEKEKEIRDFDPVTYWLIYAHLKNGSSFRSRLIKIDGDKISKPGITKKGEFEKYKKELKEEGVDYKVADVRKSEKKRSPYPPYTTSTLQQDASIRLNYSSKYTMRLAQTLYEKGLITYHRTDSFNLSKSSKKAAKDIIIDKYGKKYYKSRNFKSKGRTQEAHEAIRPTNPKKKTIKGKAQEKKLYDLIRKRFLASQMTSAVIERKKIDVEAKQYLFRASGQQVLFNGFMKVYPIKMKEQTLPELSKGDILDLEKLETQEKETKPPARYSEASLIKELEKNDIGRPSTYAPTLATIQSRNYVKKIKKKLHATDVGIVVSNLLVNHFPDIVDLEFTAKMEEKLDKVADGKEDWKKMIKDFYEPFIKNVKEKEESLDKQNILKETDQDCPECKDGKIVIKLGKNGKFKACSNFPECEYTEPMDDEKEEIKKMKEEFGPKKCSECGSEMKLKQGRYGMFWGCTNYPDCKNTEKLIKDTGIACPKCDEGTIIKRVNRKGKIFWGCDNYPKCKFGTNYRPTGETCPECDSIVVEKKGKEVCLDKDCDYKK
ncbi:MAG: type I DNA topoisomerase [Patescibacteria group bacterium]